MHSLWSRTPALFLYHLKHLLRELLKQGRSSFNIHPQALPPSNPAASPPPGKGRLPVEIYRHRREKQSRTQNILGMDAVVARIRGSVLLPKGNKHCLPVFHIRNRRYFSRSFCFFPLIACTSFIKVPMPMDICPPSIRLTVLALIPAFSASVSCDRHSFILWLRMHYNGIKNRTSLWGIERMG